MPAATHNLTIEQGATLRRVITWKAPGGDLVDLTGARVEFQVRTSITASGPPLLKFDSDNLVSGMTIGPLDTTGVIDFRVDGSVTSGLSFKTGEWDLFVTLAGAERDKLLKGKVTLDPSVTR